MGIHQVMRKNVVYHAVKAELDEAGVPHTLVFGSKHPAVRFELGGKPRTFPIPNRPFQGPAVENYRHQMRRILREASGLAIEMPEPELNEASETVLSIVSSPSLTIDDLVAVDGEPRIHDIVLAEKLGFARPRAIRQIIDRNLRILKEISRLPSNVAHLQGCKIHDEDGYWLSKEQAIFVVMRSRTPAAEVLQVAIAAVFVAYAEGRLIPRADALPAPEPIDATFSLVPQAAPATPELLANDEAIVQILDLMRIQNEEQMRGLLSEVVPRIVEETVSAVMTPLLRQQAAWGLRKVERIEGAVSEAIRTLSSRFDTGITRSIAVTQKVGAQIAETARSNPDPAPRKAWGRPTAIDGIHTFPVAEIPSQPVLPLLEMAPPSLQTEPTYLTIQDIYRWQRIPRGVSRSSLAQSIRHSLEAWFGDRVASFGRVYVESMGNHYVAYPETDLRAWYEAQGRELIAAKIAR